MMNDTIELWEQEIEQEANNMQAVEEARIYNFYGDNVEPVNEAAVTALALLTASLAIGGAIIGAKDSANIKKALAIYEKNNPDLVKLSDMEKKHYKLEGNNIDPKITNKRDEPGKFAQVMKKVFGKYYKEYNDDVYRYTAYYLNNKFQFGIVDTSRHILLKKRVFMNTGKSIDEKVKKHLDYYQVKLFFDHKNNFAPMTYKAFVTDVDEKYGLEEKEEKKEKK